MSINSGMYLQIVIIVTDTANFIKIMLGKRHTFENKCKEIIRKYML